jgi:hypothetical protein
MEEPGTVDREGVHRPIDPRDEGAGRALAEEAARRELIILYRRAAACLAARPQGITNSLLSRRGVERTSGNPLDKRMGRLGIEPRT